MQVTLTGGGTGGHVIPNLAVIEELKKRSDIKIKYIGSTDGLEKSMIEKAGIEYEGVSCGKLRRYFSWQNFIDIFKIPIGIFQARKILKRDKPDVIFSKGGYVSFPVVVATAGLKIPVILHESDLRPGLANKLCMRFADKICVSFKETLELLPKKFAKKAVFTGSPVRESILKGNDDAGFKFTGLRDYKPVVLLMGGSQGAMQINKLLWESLSELSRKYQIVHVVGRGNFDMSKVAEGYKQFEYIDKELPDVYSISDIIVTRGGANTLFETALLKKKAVILPLGNAVSRGDQIDNARLFVRKFGWSMLSGNVNKEEFMDAINLAFHNQTEMKNSEVKNGLKKIVELIVNP